MNSLTYSEKPEALDVTHHPCLSHHIQSNPVLFFMETRCGLPSKVLSIPELKPSPEESHPRAVLLCLLRLRQLAVSFQSQPVPAQQLPALIAWPCLGSILFSILPASLVGRDTLLSHSLASLHPELAFLCLQNSPHLGLLNNVPSSELTSMD